MDNLGSQFAKNLKALDELENIASGLSANLLRLRSTWEQYARSIMRAYKMRETLNAGSAE